MLLPPGGKPGQILVMKDGEWTWSWPVEVRVNERRFILLAATLAVVMLLAALALFVFAASPHG